MAEPFWQSECKLCWARIELREYPMSLCGTPTVLVIVHQGTGGRSSQRERMFSLFDSSLGTTIAAWLEEEREFFRNELHNPDGLAVCITAQIVKHYTHYARVYLLDVGFDEDELSGHLLPALMHLMVFCQTDRRSEIPREAQEWPQELAALKRDAIAHLLQAKG